MNTVQYNPRLEPFHENTVPHAVLFKKKTLFSTVFSRLRFSGLSFVAGALGLSVLGLSSLLILNSSATAQQYVPTYYVDVQPILEKNCVSCHTTGGIAPFSLTTPEEAVKHAAQIGAVVESGFMPPWPPGGDSPRYLNERKLGQASKQILVDWAKAGAPLGKK
jgi:mono/diheme cytochrome c family protein